MNSDDVGRWAYLLSILQAFSFIVWYFELFGAGFSRSVPGFVLLISSMFRLFVFRKESIFLSSHVRVKVAQGKVLLEASLFHLNFICVAFLMAASPSAWLGASVIPLIVPSLFIFSMIANMLFIFISGDLKPRDAT